MNRVVTTAIVLRRIDFGEADRIITVITPDHGKLRLMAKGVRRLKSKLAGGIELFSVSQITFIPGKREIGTLASSRLQRHYRHIVERIDHVQLGYELLKLLDKVTEDESEAGYFELLEEAFAALDDARQPELIRLWFSAQLLRLDGLAPNLDSDNLNNKLSAQQRYEFSLDEAAFVQKPNGAFAANDIKFLRLLFDRHTPATLAKVRDIEALVERAQQLVVLWQRQYIQ